MTAEQQTKITLDDTKQELTLPLKGDHSAKFWELNIGCSEMRETYGVPRSGYRVQLHVTDAAMQKFNLRNEDLRAACEREKNDGGPTMEDRFVELLREIGVLFEG